MFIITVENVHNHCRVTRSRSPVLHDDSLKGQILQAESHSKYLGVDLTASLTWNTHIDRVVKKGNSMLGFLQRNLRINNQDTKASAYFTLVRPNLEYCSTVWSPHTSQAKHKIEMVQRRAARYATNRYCNMSSVTDMLENLNWETLETRRTKSQLTMMFKILHGLVGVQDNSAKNQLGPCQLGPHKNRPMPTRPIPTRSNLSFIKDNSSHILVGLKYVCFIIY